MKNDKQIVYESLLSRIRELELEVQNNKGMIVETAGKFMDSKELFAKFIKFQNAESNDLAIFLILRISLMNSWSETQRTQQIFWK